MGFLANFLILLWACLEFGTIWGAHDITPNSYYYGPQETILDVLKFGAVGDGTIDDSKAFDSAWKAACKGVSERVKISVPSGKTFLLSPMAFQGPCKPLNITFEVLGTIVAQPKSAWERKRPGQWLRFDRVDGLSITGNEQGVIDGRGESWWGNGYSDNARPIALQFSACNNLQISGLKHLNPPKFHISITHCDNANISRLHIIAPHKSPNTDGIDVGSSTNVRIEKCTMETGDDCIAIKGGAKNITISEIKCGPGHGISIGSLGKSEKHDEVETLIVRNCIFNRADNGVRIKTWQGGSGFVRNINFFNISFIETNHPIIIDQFYCPHKTCSEKTSAVKVSDVKYIGLQGTAIKSATVSLRCSNTVPCTNILLQDIDIIPYNLYNSTSVECNNAHGLAIRTINPVVSCLVN